MKKLTRKQLKELVGFSRGNEPLKNGEYGYCKAVHILVICCENCGEYKRIHVKLNGLEKAVEL